RIEVPAGRYFRIALKQSGINVTVTLFDPNGNLLTRLNNRQYGSTFLSIIGDGPGFYLLQICPTERTKVGGSYHVVIEEARKATQKDRSCLFAEKVFAEGENLRRSWKVDSIRKAIKKYNAALAIWHAIGNSREELSTLNAITESYYALSEYGQ